MSSHNSSSRSIVCIVAAFLSITTFWEPCRAFAFQTSCMMVKRHTRIQSSANANEIEIDIDDYNDNCNNNNNSNDFEHVAAAVVVPGFLTGSDEFEPLCKSLTKMGIPTVAVPMPNWHWLPCLGGRSARPILERIDFTVKHLVANLETETETIKTKDDHPILDNNTQAQTQTHTAILNIPKYHYSLWDCWKDFRETPGGVFKVGGASRVQEYPVVEPRGYFPQPENLRAKDVPKKKIALIGHSAGGWISRVYLSSSDYGGKAYGGTDYVHSLVTLGTPHTTAGGPAFDGIRWINDDDNDNNNNDDSSREKDRFTKVRSLSVSGNGFKGDEWGDLTSGAYGFCCPYGTNGSQYYGDGVTPVFSALGMPESESLELDNVTHFCWSDVFGGDQVAPELTEDHRNGKPWYGSEGIVEQWAGFINEATWKSSSSVPAASSTSSSSTTTSSSSEETVLSETNTSPP